MEAPFGVDVLYTRHSHGNHPVQILSWAEGKELFQFQEEQLGPKELLRRITGRVPTMSWRRYFKLTPAEPSITQFLATIPRRKSKRPPTTPGRLTIGIDLRHRYEEVRKIIYKGFRARILASGFDLEDVLQEVYLGLVVRNNGRCPWDARKSSFGHYVHMVTSCLLANYHRKEVRRPERNADALGPDLELGVYDLEQGETGEKLAIESLERFLGEGTSKRVLGPLLQGKSKREIASDLDLPESAVAKAISNLRGSASSWKNLGMDR